MKRLLLAILIAALAACAGAPPASQSIVQAPTLPRTFAAATLASAGTFEMKTAPAYTQLAKARHDVTVALEDHHITVELAKTLQALADKARKKITDAAWFDFLGNRQQAQDTLADAWATIHLVEEGAR